VLSRKVAGSVPDVINIFFNLPNPSSPGFNSAFNRNEYQEGVPPYARRLFKTVVFNIGYAYPQKDAKTSYEIYKIKKI
jgi:hypothetical protein